MKYNADDTLNFGKLKGHPVRILFSRKYYPYLVWVRNNIKWFELSESADKELRQWLDSLPSPNIESHRSYKPMDNHNDLETDVYGISGPNGGWGSFM